MLSHYCLPLPQIFDMAFDLAFIIVLIWAAYRGFTKGVIVQAASLAALILGIWGAVRFSDYTTQLLIEKTNMSGEYLPIISFALTFVVFVIAIHLLARVLEKLVQAVALGVINRLAGALFSMTKYALIISGLLVVLNTINTQKPFLPADKLEQSKMYIPLSRFAPSIFPYLKFNMSFDHIEEKAKEGLNI